jgi:hypothetical protein
MKYDRVIAELSLVRPLNSFFPSPQLLWLAWNELAIPETFWSESLEVLMKIEGDPGFEEGEKGSPQDIHKIGPMKQAIRFLDYK